ncbi:MAG: hypothetical protein CMM62_01020 [Rhodospirillaceae bacterium]|jgi:AraC family transcriptional regulator|nr:hypothetical protein [Rhodospirillaceae bacterium]MAX61860.1 hypothetical protein [Rhodospirillaceae bacterium]|tara:strand:+ start:267 stop:1094 length:828 start_codon:yes stop_codon:yes gene_type:complete
MFEDLTIASALSQVSSSLRHAHGTGGITGIVLWERNNDGPINYLAPNHHTLSIYQGGGTGTWSYETRSWGFSDAICVLPQGYDSRWNHSGYVKTLHLYFTTQELEALNWFPTRDFAPMIYGRSPFLSQFSSLLNRHISWTDASDRLSMDHAVLAMLAQISSVEKSSAQKLPNSTMRKLEERMNALEDGIPTLAELAELAGLSSRHLTRLFKLNTKMTILARQREIQIETAQRLLLGELSIAEIAQCCGFSSQSHLTNLFKARTGLPPMKWRKQFR